MSPSKYVFKIILVGNGRVGKTSLLLRFTENKFSAEYKKTLGTDFAVKNVVVNGEEVKLQIWDLGGQELFRDLRRAFYPGAKAALIVYDVTNRRSFESVPAWHADIISALKKIPVIVVGNKIDLPREVSYEEAKKLCDRLEVEYIETSAKLDQNVADTFMKIASNAVAAAKGVTPSVKTAVPVVESASTISKPVLTMPKVFEQPKTVSSKVYNFYQWFDKNTPSLNSIAEDLLTLSIVDEIERFSKMEGILFRVLDTNNLNYSLEANNTCLKIYHDSQKPVLNIILDLNLNNVEYFKKCLITLTLAAVALKRYNLTDSVNYYIIFGDYLKEDETYLAEITKRADYTIMLVEREFDSIGIIPKRTLTYTISFTGDKRHLNPNILNNALLKYTAKLFKESGEPLEEFDITNSKINVNAINSFNPDTSSSSITVDFSVNYVESHEKIKQLLRGLKQAITSEDNSIDVNVIESAEKLSPMITNEAPLLLVLRDVIYYNLERLVKITYEEPYSSIAKISSMPKPLILLGFSKIPFTNTSEVFSDFILPAKILAGAIVDLSSLE
ncbi:MAG: GTP-binding protein [Candidatus Odinarchaeum yellowstonii]|uniref:GTP-binding protein n=1 Tax=Odinarchaeota yellowstonii (strain LCB_4) TaxID=1841599 RepID=A0AAF0IAS8_ODILC|nr:MAG: GTP-binding protein [Candidatus Odinarchaeum yellowstonii]